MQHWRSILENKKYHDVQFILPADPTKNGLKAHKLVLCCTSPVFEEQFANNEIKANLEGIYEITITDYTYETISQFINYLYLGEISYCWGYGGGGFSKKLWDLGVKYQIARMKENMLSKYTNQVSKSEELTQYIELAKDYQLPSWETELTKKKEDMRQKESGEVDLEPTLVENSRFWKFFKGGDRQIESVILEGVDNAHLSRSKVKFQLYVIYGWGRSYKKELLCEENLWSKSDSKIVLDAKNKISNRWEIVIEYEEDAKVRTEWHLTVKQLTWVHHEKYY